VCVEPGFLCRRGVRERFSLAVEQMPPVAEFGGCNPAHPLRTTNAEVFVGDNREPLRSDRERSAGTTVLMGHVGRTRSPAYVCSARNAWKSAARINGRA
jgi:hypothetical protein